MNGTADTSRFLEYLLEGDPPQPTPAELKVAVPPPSASTEDDERRQKRRSDLALLRERRWSELTEQAIAYAALLQCRSATERPSEALVRAETYSEQRFSGALAAFDAVDREFQALK